MPSFPNTQCSEERDPSDPRITLHVVNMARARDGYQHSSVDDAFAGLLDDIGPDVVHIGHLNHLSTSLVFKAKERRIPVVFTLHDYWLMCPRGQFIQMYPENPSDVWSVCDGRTTESVPSDATCGISRATRRNTRWTFPTGRIGLVGA